MVTVVEIVECSDAEVAGIVPGDRILRVNGEVVEDFLDFHFALSEEVLEVEIQAGDSGARRLRSITRTYGRELGLRVEEGPIRRCACACVFCFIDQLPPGLRQSLYVKDEDYRYSFLSGNYITGLSLKERHLERIVSLGLSPLYISVHAADPEVRARLLGLQDPAGADVMPLLRRLAGRGISFHLQAVLCPGINDGPVLDRTILELESLGPGALSLAVVPVGLTRHRNGLERIEPVSERLAAETLRLIHRRQRQFRKSGRSGRFVFAADEFYLRAGRRIPSQEAYEGFPQLENGVGLVRSQVDSLKRALRNRKPWPLGRERCYRVVTGTSFGPVVEGLLAGLGDLVPARLEIVAVKNRLLGQTVTVAGLLAGGDILRELKALPPADGYLVPGVALNAQGRFLDDMTLDGFREALAPAAVVVFSELARALDELAALENGRI
ncbi:MAG: DUF512 domain-containing protein [Gemmatimonadota bacterium]|nr:DUF512 domain-containing protein [Gemmatimonadota bacterium]